MRWVEREEIKPQFSMQSLPRHSQTRVGMFKARMVVVSSCCEVGLQKPRGGLSTGICGRGLCGASRVGDSLSLSRSSDTIVDMAAA